jgi:hypothetical protein
VIFHPATLLFGWGVFVALVQPLSGAVLVWIAGVILPLAILVASRRVRLLLRRSRWLLLSIALLFVFATPGQRMPGVWGELGITLDGLLLALEHVLRLMLLLASLAVVHERLGTAGMMAGLYWLMWPLAHWRTLREKVVVRLMLVLDHVENSPAIGWREWLDQDFRGPDEMLLNVGSPGFVDLIVLVLLVTLIKVSGAFA